MPRDPLAPHVPVRRGAFRHPGEIPHAVIFLTTIGSECEPHHPSVAGEPEFRSRARIVLARHVIRQLTTHPPLQTDEMQRAVSRALWFYGIHEDHAALNACDHERVCEFLERVTPAPGARPHRDDAARALAVAGAWEVIERMRVYESMPYIASTLARDMETDVPAITEHIWNPILRSCAEDSSDLIGCIARVGLSDADMDVFRDELSRMIAFCGKALDHDLFEDAAGGVELLLRFAGRLYAAVLSMRG